MKILIISSSPKEKGPISKHTPLLVDGLRRLDNDILLFFRQHTGDELNIMYRIFKRLVDIFYVLNLLIKYKYDLIIIKTGHDYRSLLRDIPLLMTIKLFSIKTILQFHGSNPELFGKDRMFKYLSGIELKLANGAFLLSTEEIYYWKNYFSNFPFLLVHNPLPPINDIKIKRSYESNNKVTFLFVGRIIREKGIFDLINAFRRVLNKYDCKLHIVGDGKDVNYLKNEIKNLNLEQNVILKGYLEGQELWSSYKNSDIFVFPSYTEGQPTVLMEASYFNLPIIATNIRAVKDIFRNGVNGYFYQPRDINCLVERMIELIINPETRENMGKNNKKLIGSFNGIEVAKRYQKSINKIVFREYNG